MPNGCTSSLWTCSPSFPDRTTKAGSAPSKTGYRNTSPMTNTPLVSALTIRSKMLLSRLTWPAPPLFARKNWPTKTQPVPLPPGLPKPWPCSGATCAC